MTTEALNQVNKAWDEIIRLRTALQKVVDMEETLKGDTWKMVSKNQKLVAIAALKKDLKPMTDDFIVEFDFDEIPLTKVEKTPHPKLKSFPMAELERQALQKLFRKYFWNNPHPATEFVLETTSDEFPLEHEPAKDLFSHLKSQGYAKQFCQVGDRSFIYFTYAAYKEGGRLSQ